MSSELAVDESAQIKRRVLIEYLNVKVIEGDWHGVSDAANDLRVLEAQHPGLAITEKRS